METKMFGMTKKQFLKKSKKCLQDTGVEILLVRELMDKETQKTISISAASRKLDDIRRDIEKIFSQYEKLSPPSKCVPLHRKILQNLFALHEAVVVNSESLNAAREGEEEKSQEKLEESRDKLKKFREDFRPLSREIDLYLQKKK
jgi:hypothetical protein